MIKGSKEVENDDQGVFQSANVPSFPQIPSVKKKDKKKLDFEFDAEQSLFGFSLGNISVKIKTKDEHTDVDRSFTMVVHSHMPQIAFGYNVVMICQTGYIDRYIKRVKEAKQKYESQQQQDIFSDLKIKELKKFDERIQKAEDGKKELEKICTPILFSAHVLKVDNSGIFPKIEMLISEETTSTLNRMAHLLDNYEIQLQPLKKDTNG